MLKAVDSLGVQVDAPFKLLNPGLGFAGVSFNLLIVNQLAFDSVPLANPLNSL